MEMRTNQIIILFV